MGFLNHQQYDPNVHPSTQEIARSSQDAHHFIIIRVWVGSNLMQSYWLEGGPRTHRYLGGGNSNIFMFTPIFAEDETNFDSY